jgi:acetyl esterase/lipase
MAAWSAQELGDPGAGALAVFVHGGFWRARYDSEAIGALARACGTAGLWAWNIEYPRVGMAGGGWPGTALAVGDAVDAAVAAAGTRPVVVIGHSAGGHLALWASRDRPGVSAVVSLAGVCDLRGAARERLGDGAVFELLGDAAPGDELYNAASPIERLPLGVPSLLIHGDADDHVPVSQSRDFLAAAAAAGDACELQELPGGDHFEVIDPVGRAWPVLRARLQAMARPS